MTAPPSHTSPDDTKRKIDLNLTQVAAAALAAVTAAVLGSELGAAGTLIGAAGASVITTVGTAVYKASLERSRARVRSLSPRTRPLPTSQQQLRTKRFDPAAQSAPLREEQGDQSARGPRAWERFRRFSALRWGAMVVGAVVGFLLAMMIITGFEWASGETMGGKEGTTIGRVVTDPAPRKPATPPASSSPAAPAPETLPETTETTDASDTATTGPDDDAEVEESPTETSDRPAPTEVTSTPPLIPGLPGVGG